MSCSAELVVRHRFRHWRYLVITRAYATCGSCGQHFLHESAFTREQLRSFVQPKREVISLERVRLERELRATHRSGRP